LDLKQLQQQPYVAAVKQQQHLPFVNFKQKLFFSFLANKIDSPTKTKKIFALKARSNRTDFVLNSLHL